MPTYRRMRATKSDEVPVSAEAFWTILRDWPAIKSWMRAENPPVNLIKVELKPGHQVDSLPCCRLCYVDSSGLPAGLSIPEVSAETLLHADPEAFLIYYNIEGEGPFGMRNYLASTVLDPLGPERTRVTCSGRWDMPEGAPADAVKAAVEAIYDSIINDIALTAQGRSPAIAGPSR